MHAIRKPKGPTYSTCDSAIANSIRTNPLMVKSQSSPPPVDIIYLILQRLGEGVIPAVVEVDFAALHGHRTTGSYV